MNKKFFIGVDSDGTAFNSMSIKHKNAFIPIFIEIWGYSEHREAVTQICERINLYSKTRGIDRFSGLLLTFDEIKRHGIETPDYRSLRGFLKCGALSNAGLREYIRQNKDDFLENVLLWSEAADKKFQLRLDDWLDADAFNFAHDICGIENNINRNDFPNATFGYFVPRFSGNR